MSKESESTEAVFEKSAEKVRQYAKSNPGTIAVAAGVGVSVVIAGLAYWRLRAKEHPCSRSIELPFHPLLGHLPAMQDLVERGVWFDKEVQMTTKEEVFRQGIVTLCFPNLMSRYLHYIIDPKLIRYLFTELDMPKGDLFGQCFAEIVGNGIFGSSGEEWKAHRAITSRMFSMRNLKDFMFECSSRAAERTVSMLMSRMMVDGINSDIKMTTVDMFDVIGRFTLDSFVEISFGRQCESIEAYPRTFEFGAALDRAMAHCTGRIKDLGWQMKKTLNIGNEALFAKDIKVIYEFVDNLLDLDNRMIMIDEDETTINMQQHCDIISLYLQKNYDKLKQLNKTDLRFIALNMIAAGRDTTRNLIAWCLALLCTSETKWLTEIMTEIIQISSKDLSYEQCNKMMPITECVLLETLRLYPSVVCSIRQINKDTMINLNESSESLESSEMTRVILKKGELIQVNHYCQARNPWIYGKDASEFNPLRWREKGLKTYPSHIFGAFHLDPRVCLGRHFALISAKCFLFYFLKSLDYQSVGHLFPQPGYSGILNMQGGWKVDVFENKSRKKVPTLVNFYNAKDAGSTVSS